jgi:hypothetical protein
MSINMKNRLLILLSLFTIVFLSCKKDEHKIYLEGGTAPVLTSSVTGSIPLSFASQDKEAFKLSWTNPNYQFTTGTSSQDVNYTIEIDTTGADFSNPKKQTIVISKDLSQSFTQSKFNDYLLNQLVLKPDMPHNIEIRVSSSLTGGSVVLPSNVLKFAVTPYSIPPKVVPPASGKLFITGSATPASWQCGCGEPELVSQQFTQVSPTLYVLSSIALTGGGSYLFIPVYGDWGNKYGFDGANNQNDVNGDNFKKEGGDIKAPAASGNYKIEVDFQRGKFTVTKL